jgi:hypothetical protein
LGLRPSVLAGCAPNPIAAAALPRRTELLRRLERMGLPFAAPAPLSDVVRVEGRTAVAVSWVEGQPCLQGEGGEPGELTRLLLALQEVDCQGLQGLLGAPHEYAGGPRWAEILQQDVIPRPPHQWRPEARRRVQPAARRAGLGPGSALRSRRRCRVPGLARMGQSRSCRQQASAAPGMDLVSHLRPRTGPPPSSAANRKPPSPSTAPGPRHGWPGRQS